jgi:hypothetical protein
LPHAEIAAKFLVDPISPGAVQMNVEAHQLLLDIQSRLTAK